MEKEQSPAFNAHHRAKRKAQEKLRLLTDEPQNLPKAVVYELPAIVINNTAAPTIETLRKSTGLRPSARIDTRLYPICALGS